MSFKLSGGSPTVEVSASAWISSQTDTTATIKVQSNSWMVYSGSWVQSSGVVADVYIGSSPWLGRKTIFGNGTYTSGTDTHSVTHSYTVNKGTSSQSVYWQSNFHSYVDGSDLGCKDSRSGSLTVGAKTSYTVSYNANGGSGAPSSQTKWYGTNLTLSSTKPTRTGYSFQGWGTSASDTSVDYAAGATYSKNAGATLYAIWKANTYAVKYDANGGTGAPSQQTKIYGVDLTLSSTDKLTRTNYNFKGWGTSASATTVSYAAGDKYKNNAAITLYAVWELAYWKPKITNMSVSRCTSDGTIDDFGTYLKIIFNWELCQLPGVNEISSITVDWTGDGTTDATISASGTSGTVNAVVGAGAISTETIYTVTVTVTDSASVSDHSTSFDRTVSTGNYLIDFKAGGTGIAIGKTATVDGALDIYKQTIVRGNKDASGTAASGQLIIGDPDGVHIAMDNNEIMAKSNATTPTGISINYDGGNVGIGGDDSVILLKGDHVSLLTNMRMSNGKAIYGLNTSGTVRSMMQLNASNQMVFGYGSYANSEGASYFDGNSVNIRSKSAIAITSPTAGLTARHYGVNKVLATVGMYMSGSHTATLSEAVSAQPHGIVLVWSWYNSGAKDWSWSYHFVPKYHINAASGGGLYNTILDYDGYHMIKYVYVSDTTIRGNDVNDDGSTTAGGVTFRNNSYVLRYVLGV